MSGGGGEGLSSRFATVILYFITLCGLKSALHAPMRLERTLLDANAMWL